MSYYTKARAQISLLSRGVKDSHKRFKEFGALFPEVYDIVQTYVELKKNLIEVVKHDCVSFDADYLTRKANERPKGGIDNVDFVISSFLTGQGSANNAKKLYSNRFGKVSNMEGFFLQDYMASNDTSARNANILEESLLKEISEIKGIQLSGLSKKGLDIEGVDKVFDDPILRDFDSLLNLVNKKLGRDDALKGLNKILLKLDIFANSIKVDFHDAKIKGMYGPSAEVNKGRQKVISDTKDAFYNVNQQFNRPKKPSSIDFIYDRQKSAVKLLMEAPVDSIMRYGRYGKAMVLARTAVENYIDLKIAAHDLQEVGILDGGRQTLLKNREGNSKHKDGLPDNDQVVLLYRKALAKANGNGLFTSREVIKNTVGEILNEIKVKLANYKIDKEVLPTKETAAQISKFKKSRKELNQFIDNIQTRDEYKGDMPCR